MATVLNGKRATAALIVSGAGKLLGFLVSHNQATVQTLTFYNNTTATGTVLLTVYIAPEKNPVHIRFRTTTPVEFTIGLAASYANCELAVWAVDYA
jgi:hypothetical protein